MVAPLMTELSSKAMAEGTIHVGRGEIGVLARPTGVARTHAAPSRGRGQSRWSGRSARAHGGNAHMRRPVAPYPCETLQSEPKSEIISLSSVYTTLSLG